MQQNDTEKEETIMSTTEIFASKVFDDKVRLTFTDGGKEYHPLEKPDPDITLSADQRDIGGLGIFLTKKLSDKIDYKYENNKNVLTLEKNFG